MSVTNERGFDAGRPTLQVRRKIPADTARITPAVDEVMGLMRRWGCAAGSEFEVETALREALANAILHGCHGDPRKEVEYRVACDERRRLRIVVRDPGGGFDPASVPSPTNGREIGSPHGRGLYLIRRLMDEVRFEKGGAEIHMVKR